jgi:hypothetical protein
MASSTAFFLRALTTAVPLSMRDTVLGETSASCATISRVTGPFERMGEALATACAGLLIFICGRLFSWIEV